LYIDFVNDFELNQLMRPPKVCLCKGVSEQDIIDAVKDGKKRFGQIIKMTYAGTSCNTCMHQVKAAFDKAIKLHPLENENSKSP